jgi:hypothetical protein
MDVSKTSHVINRHEMVQNTAIGRVATIFQAMLPRNGDLQLSPIIRREFGLVQREGYSVVGSVVSQFLAGVTRTFVQDVV